MSRLFLGLMISTSEGVEILFLFKVLMPRASRGALSDSKVR